MVSKARKRASSITGLYVLMKAYFQRSASGRRAAASKSASQSEGMGAFADVFRTMGLIISRASGHSHTFGDEGRLLILRMRNGYRFGLLRTFLAEEDAQDHHRRDGKKLALPVLERFKPKLRGSQISNI